MPIKKPLYDDNGITIKNLKDFIKDWPEKDDNGEDYEVWLAGPDGYSNECVELIQLNQGDILLGTRKRIKSRSYH